MLICAPDLLWVAGPDVTGVVQEVLGAEFQRLPNVIQHLHNCQSTGAYAGIVTVAHGNFIARFLCRLGGFPPQSTHSPIQLKITGTRDIEHWHRNFAGHVLQSTLRPDALSHVAERFGPFTVVMRPQVLPDGLKVPVTGLRVFGVPVPRFLLRQSGGRETLTADGRVDFEVRSEMWGVGLLIDYRGTLAPADPTHQ